MKKSSLEDTKKLFEDLASEEARIASELDVNVKRMSEKHDTIAAIKTYVDTLTNSFKKGYPTLSGEEKEKLVNLFIDRITSYLDNELKSARDSVMTNRGKSAAGNDASKRILEKYDSALNELIRVEEVAQKLENNEEIPNGRKRKTGTRPEKLSVLRKAQELVQNKHDEPESEQN
jgi:hypothetical protein